MSLIEIISSHFESRHRTPCIRIEISENNAKATAKIENFVATRKNGKNRFPKSTAAAKDRSVIEKIILRKGAIPKVDCDGVFGVRAPGLRTFGFRKKKIKKKKEKITSKK